MDDLSKKINDLFTTPEGLKQVEEAMGMLKDMGFDTGGDASGFPAALGGSPAPASPAQAASAEDPFSELMNPQTLMKLQRAFSAINSAPDDRVTLLTALRPHMSERRRGKVDMAIRLLRMSALSGTLKELF